MTLTEGTALKLGKMNALSTSEMNVLSTGKVNTLSLLYVLSHTSCIFRLKLLWEENTLKTSIDLITKIIDHLGILLTFPALVPCIIAMRSALIPNNIAMLAKS